MRLAQPGKRANLSCTSDSGTHCRKAHKPIKRKIPTAGVARLPGFLHTARKTNGETRRVPNRRRMLLHRVRPKNILWLAAEMFSV